MGMYGYRARACWHAHERNVHDVGGESSDPATTQEDIISDVAGKTRDTYHEWVLTVHVRELFAAMGGDDMSETLLGSGACGPVCPRSYRSEVAIGKADGDFSLHPVTCNQIKFYGHRIVWYTVGS